MISNSGCEILKADEKLNECGKTMKSVNTNSKRAMKLPETIALWFSVKKKKK